MKLAAFPPSSHRSTTTRPPTSIHRATSIVRVTSTVKSYVTVKVSPVPKLPNGPTNAHSTSHHLTTGAWVGIGVGAAVILIAVIVLIVLCCCGCIGCCSLLGRKHKKSGRARTRRAVMEAENLDGTVKPEQVMYTPPAGPPPSWGLDKGPA